MTETPAPPSPGTALVTGAAHRIGRAIALDLARHGFAVAIHYNRSREQASALVKEIESAGGRATALPADLLREDEVATLVPRAAEALGPLGLLVNNASSFEVDTAETATRESWDLNLNTNLRAPFVLCQAFARQLPEDAEGNIVNLIDQRVLNLTPYFVSYTVSKAGLWTLTRTLALAFAPRIRVNAIGPGPVLPSRRQTPEQFERQWRSMPLKRGATLDEICAGVRFFLKARSLTGQLIALDGGQHLGWAQESRGVIAEE
jgi:NAD(P)-dependent dehydrogenase (short-subunit alcohol dehydrogenase family)